MPRKFAARCDCCGLNQLFVDHDGLTRPAEKFCSTCYGHRGQIDSQTLRRAQDHERMLRERLHAAESWASRAEEERDEYRDRMKSALESRDRGVRLLQTLNDLHELRPNGSCSCGAKRDCKSARALYGRWAQEMIRRADERDERAQRYKELSILDGDDNWMLTEEPRRTGGDSATA